MILAIDIGGTEVKYGLINNKQDEIKIMDNGSYKTNAIKKKGLGIEKDIISLVKNFQKRIELDGVAISTAGIVSPLTEEVVFANKNIPGYIGVNLTHSISSLGLQALTVNDVNAAAFGEYMYGAAKKSKNTVCLTVGTGIGGAIILDGEIYKGSNGGAGEVGYMSLGDSTFENLASTTALIDRVQKQKGTNKTLDGLSIFEMAKNGDSICIQEINHLCYWLAKGISNLVVTLQPDRIVLGGGIMEQKSFLKPIIDAQMKKMLPSFFKDNISIRFADLGNKAGMIGAYFLLKEHLNKK